MNYWLLTTEYPPFFGGGISTYCYYTVKMLSDQGHSVTVFINDHSIKERLVEIIKGIRVVRFNPGRSTSSSHLGHSACVSYEFAQILKSFIEKEGKPDIIEAQEYLGIAYYLLQFKHLQYDWCKDVPMLITMHSPAFLYLEYNHVPLYKYPNYWIGEMERFSIQAADAVVSPSKFLIEEVAKRFKYHHSNFFVVANPFESDKASSEAFDKKEQEDIVFFGKLSAQKGTFKLLKYFEDLWSNGFSEPLYLIGGQDIVYHPEGKPMGDLVRKRYKDQVLKGQLKLEDKVEPAGIHTRLKRAKVVIIPSTVDNLPYVVLETMSLGLVVLVSKQGGQAEIVTDGVNGFVFDHSVPSSFSSQLAKVLELTTKERDEIGRNASIRVHEGYNLSKIYKEKLNIILGLNEKKKSTNNFPFIRQKGTTSLGESGIKKNNQLLSVVIPYFNMGRYIKETVTSVRNSDFKNKEIIIVNDGSSEDESISELLLYRNDSDVRVIDIPNKGLSCARNIGAQNSKGEFLAFLDADDLISQDYFSKAVKVLSSLDNVHFVGSWTQYFEESTKVWPTFTPEPPLILYHNLVNSSALVYKTESFLKAGFNDEHMLFQGLEDYESVISLVKSGLYGVILPETHFFYRVRKDSMIRGVSNIKKTVLHDFISKKHEDFFADYASDLINLANSNGPGTLLDNPSLDTSLMQKFPFNNFLVRELISTFKRNKTLKNIGLQAYRLISK